MTLPNVLLKDLLGQRLWRLPDGEPYQHIEPALAGKLNVNLIRDSLSRKVFFGSLGEIRERTYEEQLNTASSLNLLLAAIVVWNTVHLQACVRKLRSDGEQVNDEDLRHLSPLLRHHIGIYGQYNFDFRRFEAAAPVESLTY